MVTRNTTAKVVAYLNQKSYIDSPNHFKQILRALINTFGNLYYVDGNKNTIRIKCSTGKPERNKGKDGKDNTLILPYITVSERGVSNDDDRRRYLPVLVNEVEWNPDSNKAERYLSLAPRPILVKYDINLWTKFMEDMDVIRTLVFHLFNPDLEIRTLDNDLIKAFVVSEDSIESEEQQDTKDRVLKKRISIEVETYLKSPKILFTNTDQIDNLIFELEVTRQGCE